MRKLLTAICVLLFVSVNVVKAQDSDTEGELRTWDFTSPSASDQTNAAADASWMTDSKSRYCYTPAMNGEPAMANGSELELTKGLHFTIPSNAEGSLRFGGSTASLWMGYTTGTCVITIPDCKAGQWIKVEYMTSKNGTERSITATNLNATLPSTSSKTHVTGQSKITADGEVTLSVTQGMYFYNLAVGDSILVVGGGGGGGTSPDNPDNPTDTDHTFNVNQGYENFALLCDSTKCNMATNGMVWGKGPKIYVSPTGDDSNDGTQAKPYASIQKAVDMALEPGTTIILAAGEYRPTARINIDDRNGLHNNYNALVCIDGRATINCDHPYHSHSDNPYQGVRLTSSYWFFYHVDITNASDNGMLIERNKPTGGSSADIAAATDQAHDNVIDACNFYKNGDTGLQMKNLASYNYIINCDSYLNCDEDQGDADGFAPKISVGSYNYFFGCRAYLNSDDGWDVFYKKDGNFGDNQTIIMDRCIAYKNGYLDENTIASDGNGNGFKCGSNQGAMNVYLTRCLAVMNKAKGFDQNHNSGDIILTNCTGYVNTAESCFSGYSDKAYSYRIYEDINTAEGHKVELSNCIAINDNGEKDKRDSSGNRKEGENGKQGSYGRFEVDETLEGLTVTDCEFADARPEFFQSLDHTQLILPRVKDQLQEITFAHIKPGMTTTYTATDKKSYTVTSNALIGLGAYEASKVTAVSSLSAAQNTGQQNGKLIKAGRIVIVKDNHIYNVTGQQIK